MSGVPYRRITLPADREAWRQTREARRILLDKVRARRRLIARAAEAKRRGVPTR
jgi:hypothetical protein